MDISEDVAGAPAHKINQMIYGKMCQRLAMLIQKMTELVPVFEALQPPGSGMQALCGLHWSIEKAKLFLYRTVNSSKLYLAITSDSVTSKFEKVKQTLYQSLRRLEINVPDGLVQQISVFTDDLQGIDFQPDASDQEVGNAIISLLHNDKEFPGVDAPTELDVFDDVVLKLGIKSAKALLSEKRALRRLLEKTRKEEDKKKELVVLYLLHLLRRYIKEQNLAANDHVSSTGADVTSSYPPSPSDRGSEASTSGLDSDFSSESCGFGFYNKRLGNGRKEGSSCLYHSFVPPEEFRCPLSLQLMSDPVIISSGQTYERVCIEKWFAENHDTCPKTQQKLSHLNITPNYCVKALIMSWCERHLVPIPTPPSPPPSPVTNWRYNNRHHQKSSIMKLDSPMARLQDNGRSLTVRENEQSSMMEIDDSVGDCYSSVQIGMASREVDGGAGSIQEAVCLLSSASSAAQCKGAEEIRRLTKDDPDARIFVGESGSIRTLVRFLSSVTKCQDENAQEIACLALSNVAINNDRNKAEMLDAGTLPLLLNLLGHELSLRIRESAISVLLSMTCLDENKAAIGASGAIKFLVDHLDTGSPQGAKDALISLSNLSKLSDNCRCMLKDGAIPKLFRLLGLGDVELIGKCIAILYEFSSTEEGRSAIVEADGGLSMLVEVMDSGSSEEKELVASILFDICTSNRENSQAVLKEGVIPSLVMLSVSGSPRGKDKALKLLQHFREERQKDSVWQAAFQTSDTCNGKDIQSKSERGFFRRKTFRFLQKSKSFSFYHC